MNNYGRGRNKGKINRHSTNRTAGLSMTVNVDPRYLAEAIETIESLGLKVGSKSDLGRTCIELIANMGKGQHGVEECEQIDQAMRYLKRKGMEWTRKQDKVRIGNLLKMESAYVEGYGSGFDSGAYERPTVKSRIEQYNEAADAFRGLGMEPPSFEDWLEEMEGSGNVEAVDDESYVSDPDLPEEELARRRELKDQREKDKLKQSTEMIRRQMKGGDDSE